MANYTAVDELVYSLSAEIKLKGKKDSIALNENEISQYTLNGTMSSQCIPLGAAAAMTFSLTFNNQEHKLTALELDNAEVRVYVLDSADPSGEPKDFGVWYVEDIQNSEQNPFCVISGSDALNSKFNDKWTDVAADYPRTLRMIARTMCATAGVSFNSTSFHNANYVVEKMPEWGEDCTIRDVISYIAICASGFARINYSGQLEICTIGNAGKHTATADYYSTFTSGGFFDFNCLQYRFETEDDEEEAQYTRFAIDGNIADNATNTIQMSGVPLITDAMANDIAQTLQNVNYEGASITWFGGVDVLPGDELELTLTDDSVRKLILNSHSMQLDGGITANSMSDLPSSISQTSYYTDSVNAFNPDGTINAEAISGLNKKVISANVGYFDNLTAENVKAAKLLTAIIEATELRAESIQAEEVSTDKLTAAIAAIFKASIDCINAGITDTGTLYANVAEIIALKVNSLAATRIDTDSIYSSVADFGNVYAGVGEFELARIKNLLAGALTLQRGNAESMYITNLAVTSANIMSAVLGELVFKQVIGEGDNASVEYYRIYIDAAGMLQTERVTVETDEDEFERTETSAGRKIVETSAVINDINGETLNYNSGNFVELITDTLNAGHITATEAFLGSANIPKLNATAINAIGDSMTFEANETIKFVVGEAEKSEQWFTFDDETGLTIRKPNSPWSTVTDEDGYHIKRDDIPGYVGSFAKDRLITRGVQVGDILCKKTNSGGWVWTEA